MRSMEENLKNKLIEEALKVDDSEMLEDADIPLPNEIGFANDLYDLISGLYSDESDLNESLPLFKKKSLLIDKDISGYTIDDIEKAEEITDSNTEVFSESQFKPDHSYRNIDLYKKEN